MNQKYIVTFAGPPGSSKSPIANYLSTLFGLPIFNNDAIRSEVIEDFLYLNEEEQVKRRDERLNKILAKGESFILDASIDRLLGEYANRIEQLGYKHFIISMDLSKEFLIKLYKAKDYDKFPGYLDRTLDEHKDFIEKYNGLVNIHINDNAFPERLRLCEESLADWLKAK